MFGCEGKVARRSGCKHDREAIRPAAGVSRECPPEFHANKTVEFFAVATDFAGHSSRLGGPDQPLKLKKRWLF